MQIIDSHVHFWQPDKLDYRWLIDAKALNNAFLPEQLVVASEGVAISGIVFVQADCLPEQSVQEVDWITTLASTAPIKAIVAAAPLETGESVVALLETYTKYPLVKGIRRLLQSEPDDFMSQTKFIQGVRTLTKYNLSFDICIKPHQLGEVITLVQECPDVMFVLDHLGKPGIAHHEYEPWCRQIHRLAGFENVCVKISGLVTEADHQHWLPEDLKPFIYHVFETFGIHRIMFGSDWPVCTLAASYKQWLDTLLQIVEQLTPDEKHLLLFENARKFYRLNL